jgi:hypothetical protein
MLPFDNRPWARPVAGIVVALSFLAAILGAYYLNDNDELHIPEVTGILLLLLAIVPPNLAILSKKSGDNQAKSHPINPTLHPR